jgi:hypothetical protein
MATKGEERLETVINRHFERLQGQVSDQILSIFLMGIVAGVVLSNTGLFSIIVGLSCGYAIGRKKIPIADYYVTRLVNLCEIGYLQIPKIDVDKKNIGVN